MSVAPVGGLAAPQLKYACTSGTSLHIERMLDETARTMGSRQRWRSATCGAPVQIEGEFPELLGIKESLIKYVFEPNAAKQKEVLAAVKEMRGR